MAVAAGWQHSVALKSDGTVYAWGWDEYGQLGDGGAIISGSYSSTPVAVSSITNAIAISVTGSHNLLLKSDGTFWAWGSNGYGELGLGSTDSKSSPVQVEINLLDSDGDGLDDDWEIANFGDLTSSDGTGDPDSDGLTDLEEFQNGTDPNNGDSDGDGYNDSREVVEGTDPLDENSYFGIPDLEREALSCSLQQHQWRCMDRQHKLDGRHRRVLMVWSTVHEQPDNFYRFIK